MITSSALTRVGVTRDPRPTLLPTPAQGLEEELGPEQAMFIEGCQGDWEEPLPSDLPLRVGFDGGYLHASNQHCSREGSFEVIIHRSMPG